jgi:uncharacterized protein (TIGR00369 family)
MIMPPAPHGGEPAEWITWVENQHITDMIGMRCVQAEPGRVTIIVEASPWPLNPNGAVHGGLVLAWADHCFGMVGMTTAEPGQMPATATLTAEFVRPAIPPLTYEARVDRSGRTLTFISVNVHNALGGLCAKVSGTMSTDGNSRFLALLEPNPILD